MYLYIRGMIIATGIISIKPIITYDIRLYMYIWVIYMYIYVYIHVSIYIYKCICKNIYSYTWGMMIVKGIININPVMTYDVRLRYLYECVHHTCKHICICLYMLTHICIYKYMYVYFYMRMHKSTHTYKKKRKYLSIGLNFDTRDILGMRSPDTCK
jgi:hypothetical protein